MKILALEPYYGGSHRAFIEGWSAVSNHEWTVLQLPAYKWKWRMRHAAVTFADEVKKHIEFGEKWDIVFCSDMLNLAEFLGLAPQSINALPTVAYFHENQLTYPARFEDERDYQFVMTNITTALAADEVWFNSNFHKNSFLQALNSFLKKMPDYRLTDNVEKIRAKAIICPQGINPMPHRCDKRIKGPLRILWSARWEHDKNPEGFFEALKVLKKRNIEFRISVIGQSFRDTPKVFTWAKKFFHDQIDHWGFQETRAEYEKCLTEADLIVSTAVHEFFGISAVEAIAAGAYPMLPKRLAYPEILELDNDSSAEDFFYDGTTAALTDKLEMLANRLRADLLWQQDSNRAAKTVEKFYWNKLGSKLDKQLEAVKEQSEKMGSKK